VLTDSEFSANEITAAYGIPRGRITVAPLGVDREQFSPAPLGGVLSPDPKVGARPYVLHVGDLHARRNVIVVLRALLELFREDATQTPVLVLAGVEQGAGSALAAMAASVGASDFVVQLGTVDEARLVGLYHSALAVVYPSKYEGFGLPLAEAMSCGVPVVASCEASIPEVVGKAGLLLDPDDVVVWADAIRRLTRDPSLRARMGAAGMVRAASLTWERTAHITFSAYGRAVSGAQE
jgi:alpha-1,3-rhamnosyl/mannosyltransferase